MEKWIDREVQQVSDRVQGYDDDDLRQEGRLEVWLRGVSTQTHVRRVVRSQLNRIRLSWMTEKRVPHDRQGVIRGMVPLQVEIGAMSMSLWRAHDVSSYPEAGYDLGRFRACYPVEFDVIQKHFTESGTLDAPECEDAVRCAREFFS